MIRYFIIVSGLVQGVGFRYFAYYTAKTLELTGKARNCSNGTVEIEIQGNKDIIHNFLLKIKKGNGYCKVDNISIKKIDLVKNEKNFKVLYW